MIKLRETSKGVMFKVRVSPGRNCFEIRGFDSWSNSLLLSTKEPAERGRANKEIERELGKAFGRKVEIVKGSKSRNKIVTVQGNKEEALRVLEQLIV